jgi:tRNA(fMet)-specific endonuclease VapC
VIRFVLDTDTVSLLQDGHPTVSAHVSRYGPDEVATTIITVEEQLSAWYALLRRARTARQLVPVYERMTLTVRFLSRLPVLTFTERAADAYERLRKEKPRAGRMDLRIAAIALANGAALVTRNAADFTGIDGLIVVDWSRP